MRYLSKRQLAAFLAREVHGIRKPMEQARTPQRSKPLPAKRKGPARRETPLRDPDYKRWIRTLPSVVSGATGCDPAHTGSDGGARQKASDDSCVPLTRAEHEEYHALGREAFARRYGLDVPALCRQFRADYARLRARAVGRKSA
jgi:hypothetical protein